jgi:hypothetical protein
LEIPLSYGKVKFQELPHCRCNEHLLQNEWYYNDDGQRKKLYDHRMIKISERMANQKLLYFMSPEIKDGKIKA